ncbi:MAG: fibronectin type III domain-containing protein, partial [Nakamurella sp.]
EQKPILSRLVVTAVALLIVALAGGLTYALTRPAQAARLTAATGTPAAPTISGTTVDQATIQLTWDGQPAIDRYQLIAILEGRKGQVTEVDGAQETVQLAGLQPDTQYCYQLAAIRGEQFGPPSAIACVRTAAPPSSAARPTDDSAAGSTADVTTPVVTTVPDGGSVVIVPPATTTEAGTATSAPEPPTTSGGGTTFVTGGPSTGGGQAFGPGDYLALVYSTSTDSGGVAAATSVRDRVRAALPGGDVTVEVLSSSDYPRLLVLGRPLVVDRSIVSVGSFTSAAEVTAFCAAHATPPLATDCQVMQPVPAG